ncbi:MAG: D-alanyl-D-alanine carboxypeptidase [Brevundimonas sp.]|nr:D-alanyl-D-alanine carboxypeptidase [Brevundimonas sp.]
MRLPRIIAALALVALAPSATAIDILTPQPAAPDAALVATAPVALLVDLSAGQTLYARNEDRSFLPASMAKAMSALIAFDLIKAGKLDETTLVIVDADLAARWSGKGTTLALRAGERVSVKDLLSGMITVSANDATEVLVRHGLGGRALWLAAMNDRARALGMADSHFASPSGWPDGGKTRVTARDMVRLAKALIEEHPELYRRYFGHAAMAWRGLPLTSRNPFAGRVAGADGIKSGHTSAAGYTFLGAAERQGRRLVLVVAGLPSETARAEVARGLLEWGYAAWESRLAVRTGQIVGAAQVQDGTRRSVSLASARDWRIAVPKGAEQRVRTRIVYLGPLRAPIRRGTVVAGLEVTIGDQPPHDLPLVAGESVARAGPFDRVANGLLGLLP